jgi:hypothetical protein
VQADPERQGGDQQQRQHDGPAQHGRRAKGQHDDARDDHPGEGDLMVA